MLTGLDATVNVLDDVIDTRDLSTQSRITLTVNVAFSSVLLVESCPTGNRAEIRDAIRDYFTALFQIPLGERQLFKSMRTAQSRNRRQTAAEQIYADRARDIDAFARLPAVVTGLDPETERRLLHDLRAYRARRLLFKDIHDVERDLSDDDMTPVIHLLRECDSVDAVVDAVEGLYTAFTYSESGEKRYGDLLGELERVPEDLRSLLHDTRNLVATDSS